MINGRRSGRYCLVKRDGQGAERKTIGCLLKLYYTGIAPESLGEVCQNDLAIGKIPIDDSHVGQ